VGRLRGLKDRRQGIISERMGRLEGKSLSDHQIGSGDDGLFVSPK
jgi:hypothetical protein